MDAQGRSSKFHVGHKATLEFVVTEEEQIVFAKLSGDHNPIHTDHAYAQSRGYALPIVFGALLVAKLSQIIGVSLPGPEGIWSSLQIHFRAPLLIGERAIIEVELVQVSDATRSLMLKLLVRCGDKLIATGQSMATLYAPRVSSEVSRAVLVTGATGGIGEAVCRGLLAMGLKPIITYRLPKKSAALRMAAAYQGMPLELELADSVSIDNIILELSNLPFELVGVVHCASPAPRLCSFGRITEEDMKLFWEVNVIGPHRLFAGIVKKSLRKSQRGTLVALSSKAMGDHNQVAVSGMGAYTISKFGLCGVLALLSSEFSWLKVATVCPGFTQTKMLEAFDKRFIENIAAETPILDPTEVAAEVLRHFGAYTHVVA